MATRLPTHFAGKLVTFRIPMIMYGELLTANAATGTVFPDGTFLHNVDKPFEIHRVIMRVTPFDGAATPLIITPPFIAAIPNLKQLLETYIRVRIADTAKNENLTKNATLVSAFSKANEQVWELDDVYTMVKSEGFTVQVDNLLVAAGFTITVGNTTVTVANLRFELAFEGALIVIEPASETR